MNFSVLDVETTGFSPAGGDRVLEIGVARLDENGDIRDVFDTLLNPERPVSATHVHGISGAMVEKAPIFGDVLHRLCDVLEGTVLVAHNASFDMGFLKEEFRRAGASFPRTGTLCTLILARKYLPHLPSKSLKACRRHLGITDDGAHNALADARAAAGVLHHFLETQDLTPLPAPFRTPASLGKSDTMMLFDSLEPPLLSRKEAARR